MDFKEAVAFWVIFAGRKSLLGTFLIHLFQILLHHLVDVDLIHIRIYKKLLDDLHNAGGDPVNTKTGRHGDTDKGREQRHGDHHHLHGLGCRVIRIRLRLLALHQLCTEPLGKGCQDRNAPCQRRSQPGASAIFKPQKVFIRSITLAFSAITLEIAGTVL